MKTHFCIAILIGSLLCAVELPAQVTTATVYGNVTDTTQAVLPGASVTMTHQGTQAVTEKLTDERGEFAFPFVPVGTYTVRVEMQGFKTYVIEGLELGAAQNVRRTFVLEVGGLTDEVTVTSESQLVNTVSADQREAYTELAIKELPLLRRNITGLIGQGTGVSTSGGGVRMNGLGRSGTRISVDGTSASANVEGSGMAMFGNFAYIDVVSIEAIQEVQTTKGIVAAEYAGTLGGSVNVITRSGTNEWHGSIFENYQGAALNAREQSQLTKPPLTFNQFGGSIGGRIVRNKIFFFGGYEGYREAASPPSQGDVPTARLRSLMLAAVPDYKYYLGFFPLPNQPHDANADVGRFIGTGRRTARENHVNAKIDMLLFSNGTLGVSYTRGRPFRSTETFALSNPQTHHGTAERLTVSFVIGNSTWTGETRYGYNYNDALRVNSSFDQKDPSGKAEIAFGGRRIPSVGGLGLPGLGGEYNQQGGPAWSIEQKVSKIVGRHALKFGGSYIIKGGGRSNVETPGFTYATVADLLANIPNNVRISWGVNPFESKQYDLGFFIQDDWRFSPKLTLNFGIRYDYFSPYVAKGKEDSQPAGLYNLDGLLDSYNFIFGPLREPKRPIDPDALNLGPRFGFAYNPDGQGHTAIRGGFGVMFTSLSPSIFANSVSNSPNLPFRTDYSRAEAQALGYRYPVYNDDTQAAFLARNQVSVTDIFDPKFERPYAMNMYFGVQRDLTSRMVLETAFVGTRGVKFMQVRYYNQIDRVTGARPNPNLKEGQFLNNDQQTFYASWQSSVRQRFSQNLALNVHHTWGKGLSYEGGDNNVFFAGESDRSSIQSFNNIKIARGPNIGDRTHVVAADAVYQLPTLTGMNPVLRHIFGGWQTTGIFRAETGEAFSPTQRSTGGPPSRPDIIDFENAVNKDWRKSDTKQYLNTAAFAKVPLGAVSRVPIRPGNAGWNSLRGPGRWNLDASLGKNFAVTEKLSLQFRVDAFNALNHTNYSNPTSDIDNANFGRILTTQGARTVQVNGRLSF